MAEFRWAKRYVEIDDWNAYCEYMLDPDPPRPIETVLQVRHREGPRGEDWWGAWQDIPHVDLT